MIDSDFHKNNRHRIISATKGGVIVLTAYCAMQSSGDLACEFAQESNFWYLTGINEPDWRLIIDGTRNKTWLVRPSVSQSHQIFDGSLSDHEAVNISGIEHIISINEANDLLRNLSRSHSFIYTLGTQPDAKYLDFCLNPAQKNLRKELEIIFNEIQDCRLDLAKIRSIKQPEEISAIKKSIKLTVDAFREVKEKLPNLSFEYEVEAEFFYHFRRNGAVGYACSPIVASGLNACTLHYCANNAKFKKRDLLLLDICTRLNNYPSDISRTYSISGQPTNRQVQIHGVVDEARRRIIEIIQPGLLISEFEKKSDEIMKYALNSLNLLNTDNDFRRYFPHSISHGLGVDVHDSLGRPTQFLPGMVLTVEPGIYIPEEGIGVRVEDDVLVTENGYSNLSAALATDL